MQKMQLDLDEAYKSYVQTGGSTVTGAIVYGGDIKGIDAVQITLLCRIRTRYHRYYGGSTHDIRRETRRVVEQNNVLWRPSDGTNLEQGRRFPFSVTIPDALSDGGALPPSFDAGRRVGRDRWMNASACGIGWVRWSLVATALRPGMLKHNHHASVDLIIMPTSSPPPLLPAPVVFPTEAKLVSDLDVHAFIPATSWTASSRISSLHRGMLFGKVGQIKTSLYLPNAQPFARSQSIPYIIVLDVTRTNNALTSVDWNKASLRLHREVAIHCRGARQTLTRTSDDNYLQQSGHISIVTTPLRSSESEHMKQCAFAGTMTFTRVPSFHHQMMTVRVRCLLLRSLGMALKGAAQYSLVVEIPVAGLGNDCKLTTGAIDFMSAVSPNEVVAAHDDLPDYSGSEDFDEEEKSEKKR